MKLIVGLGNPEKKYEHTRHNLGFMVLDELAKQMKVNFEFQNKLKADVAILVHNNETLILAKPNTYMNLSGNSVARISQFYKVGLNDIWVVSDDIDIEFGKIRLRVGGSSGGHKGLKSIIEKVGSEFVRFRVGIKNSELGLVPVEKFVLKKFNTNELMVLPEIILATTKLIQDALENGINNISYQIEKR